MIQDILAQKRKLINDRLSGLLKPERHEHRKLFDAMKYSLLAGGKRVRPALFLMTLDAMGEDSYRYADTACAIECIHTYSLIHDDLPAMDNDDYRRGRYTNHKVFGAGMATLAGDGLLTYAFELIAAQKQIPPALRCELIRILSEAAGPSGMAGGQAQDLESEGQALSMEELRIMDACKTGCLFCAPIDMAAVLGRISDKERACLHEYGKHIGLLFQITDDMLDRTGTLKDMGKNAGQDQAEDKATYVTILGYDRAAQLAAEEAEKAKASLSGVSMCVSNLSDLTEYLMQRTC